MTPTTNDARKLLTPALQQKVEKRVREVLDLGSAIWPDHTIKFSTLPSIRYDIKNKFGGVAITGGQNDWTIRLNLILCYENEEHFIEQTVGHEVAHLMQFVVFGRTKVHPKTGKVTKVMAHGPEWREVMVKIGLKPLRCHTYDTSSIQNTRRRSKNGAVVSAMDAASMIKRLQNGFKRLPENAKQNFADWVKDAVYGEDE